MITSADVGKRVSVQFYDDDGAKTEAVGLLERAEKQDDDVMLCIRRRDDSLVRVPLRRLKHGKVIPGRHA